VKEVQGATSPHFHQTYKSGVGKVPQVPDLPDLSDDMAAIYQRILHGESVPPGTPGLTELLAGGLVAVNRLAGQDTYNAIEPRYAALQVTRQIHAQIAAVSTYTGALPGLLASLQDQFEAARPPHDAIQHLKGRDVINERIDHEHKAIRAEILTAQPGQRTRADLEYSYDRDRSALEQGLSMRTLYHSSVRRVPTVGDWAKAIAAAGGEIRTFNGRFPRSIIFDRRVAFVPVHTGEDEPPAEEAVMISDPLVVARIAYSFELFWERAEPWFGGSRGEDMGVTTTATQRAILRELCLGRTQAQAAKNLGIGPSWVNEQLGQLRAKLGVETLNEAIYWWATSPDHAVQD
jgi:DNA-binding CsgD family transcriptional regulator